MERNDSCELSCLDGPSASSTELHIECLPLNPMISACVESYRGAINRSESSICNILHTGRFTHGVDGQ
ncbi:hypothetical protein DPMN_149263 [Dreissena polymorpha]|uniref:Uncharacterized protein n=1 Tax=Dreissena polymorpha TaxID=45954 RepID=A0A9D4FD90_DREPO|nr:hypothetical protein DPMN_149263 [Dreissena polymorpha]